MKKILLTICAVMIFASTVFASASTELAAGIEKSDAKDYVAAIVHFDNAIKANSKMTEAYYQRGKTYLDMQKCDEAVIDFGHVIALEPKAARGYKARGAAYATKKDYEKSLVDLNKALEISPKDWETYTARSMANFQLRTKDVAYKTAAYDDINEALKLNSENPAPYGVRAIFKIADFKLVSAISDIRKSSKYEKKLKKTEKK